MRIRSLTQTGRLDAALRELARLETLDDSDAVRRQRLRGAFYIAVGEGDAEAAASLRESYADEVAQLRVGDYLGRYRLAQMDLTLTQD